MCWPRESYCAECGETAPGSDGIDVLTYTTAGLTSLWPVTGRGRAWLEHCRAGLWMLGGECLLVETAALSALLDSSAGQVAVLVLESEEVAR